MKKIIKLTEEDLVRIVKNIVKEYEFEDIDDKFISDDENFDDAYSGFDPDDDDDDDLVDKDYTADRFRDMDMDVDDEENFSPSMKHKMVSKRISRNPENVSRDSGWRKGDEIPYNPVKNSDMPLDKFLASKFK